MTLSALFAKACPASGFCSFRSAAGVCLRLCLGAALTFAARAEAQPERAAAIREPVLRIRAEATFEPGTNQTVRVGDTVVYRLRVSWNEIPAAVMLSPREALNAPGFTRAGSSVAHERTTVDGEAVNRTDYLYRLVPREAGTARIAPSVVRYHNGLKGREEELSVPAAILTVSPAAVPWTQRAALRVPAALAGAGLVGLLLLALTRRLRGRKQPKGVSPAPRESSPEASALSALRARCDAAESRVWLADAERLCLRWLCRRIGVTNTDRVRFDAALDQYLDRHRGLSLAVVESWTTLRDLFHEARYGGARREPHELREACDLLKTCLLIESRDAVLKTPGSNPS